MRAHMSQTVFIAIQKHTEDHISRLFVFSQSLKVRQRSQIQFKSLLAQGIFKSSFIAFRPANDETDILVSIVGRDSGVRSDLRQFVPAFQIVGRIVLKSRETFLRIRSESVSAICSIRNGFFRAAIMFVSSLKSA